VGGGISPPRSGWKRVHGRVTSSHRCHLSLRALVVASVAAMGSACAGVDMEMLVLVVFIRGRCVIFSGVVGLHPNRLPRAGDCLMVGAGGFAFAFVLVDGTGLAGGVVTRGFPCHSRFRGGNRSWGRVLAYLP
jgi:hypothetical protein